MDSYDVQLKAGNISDSFKRGKLALLIGTSLVALGIGGVYLSNPHIGQARQERDTVAMRLKNQEATMATLDAEVKAYWESLLKTGNPQSLPDGKTDVYKQIDAYCTTTSIFPQLKHGSDNGICAKVGEASQVAAQVSDTKRQLAAKQNYLENGGWTGLRYISIVGGFIFGGLSIFLGLAKLLEAHGAERDLLSKLIIANDRR